MNGFSQQAIVILAAGSSTRMGVSKQMLDIGGESLLGHTVSCAMASQIPNVIVVLGSHAEEHQKMLEDLPIQIVVNDEWARGMGNSIKFGVRKAIEKYPELEAVFIVVCDQPKISARHLNEMGRIHMIRNPMAVASKYGDTVGVPVVFDRSVFSTLLMIDDHGGAKELLLKLEKETMHLPFEGGEIDLDTMEDYEKFMAHKVRS